MKKMQTLWKSEIKIISCCHTIKMRDNYNNGKNAEKMQEKLIRKKQKQDGFLKYFYYKASFSQNILALVFDKNLWCD